MREGYRKTDLAGMRGTVWKCWGSLDYLAVDIELEDGCSELLWVRQLDVLKGTDGPTGARRFPLGWRG